MKRSSTQAEVASCSAQKRRRRASQSEDEDTKAFLHGPRSERQPMSKIYNSSFRNNKPAELFRKDLISAMKLPDSEPLLPEEYWLMGDAWREEWERGVQVPVNPKSLPKPSFRAHNKRKCQDFKLPLKKFLRCTVDEQRFPGDMFVTAHAVGLADQTCRYDLDDIDLQWLTTFNEEREHLGLQPIDEYTMEGIMEELEKQCFENLQAAIKSQEGLGIEYDEDVVCDVCRSPDSEDGNEMVFCDSCNICVHQACYGITSIPEGSWVCRTCALSIRPSCSLCPNRGGAMKSTRSGNKWAHVACALWVPEVSIGCVDKMEPIIKMSQIPASRWALVCSICRERTGACIQCSVRSCKTAYHVTCAFEQGLEMKALIAEEASEDEGVKLRSYCLKHSKRLANNESVTSDEDENDDVYSNHVKEDDDDDRPRRKRKNKKTLKGRNSSPGKKEKQKKEKELGMSNEENAGARMQKLKQLEADFFAHASVEPLLPQYGEDPLLLDFVFQYWKLKRRANFNRPLLTPKAEESAALERQQEGSLYARMKMFVHLRQDLERVRNLCYMVSRREKLCRSLFKMREDVFRKQASLLAIRGVKISEKEKLAVIQANHGDGIYDRLQSSDCSRFPLLTSVLSVLEGKEAVNSDLQSLPRNNRRFSSHLPPPSAKLSSQHLEQVRNRLPNPYAKQYANGIRRSTHRRTGLLFELEDNHNLEDESCNTTITSTTLSEFNDSCMEKSTSDAFNRLNSVKKDLMLQLLESPSKHEEILDTFGEEEEIRTRKVLQAKGENTEDGTDEKMDENVPVFKSDGKENTETLIVKEEKPDDVTVALEVAKREEVTRRSLRSTPAREGTPEKTLVSHPTATLVGYRIPKKKKCDQIESMRVQNSPLCEDSLASPHDNWTNGDLSPRLVIKLKKDSPSETRDCSSPHGGPNPPVETWTNKEDPFTFHVVQNDWAHRKSEQNFQDSSSSLTNKTSPRYPMRFRTLGRKSADPVS